MNELTINEKCTPLILAAAKGDLESVRNLIASGIRTNTKNDLGEDALMVAKRLKHKKIVKYLKRGNFSTQKTIFI